MIENKTIAAISTPLAAGGIGVIRVSGKDAFSISDKIFKGKKTISELSGGSLLYGKIYALSGEFIDEVVVSVFKSPKSYTGEDTVEFSCHGSPILLKKALRALLDAGASLAGKGEFTKRALLNGKLTLTEAEAVIDIINAESYLSASLAFSNRGGALFRRINGYISRLTDLAGEISAVIDFPDEDLTDIPKEEIISRLVSLNEEVSSLRSTFDKGEMIRRGIPITIAGRPNAGKSSVMNALSGTDKSIVTDIPGTTRDIIESHITIGDSVFIVSDTAGIRDTENAVEKIGVQKAKEAVDSAELVLLVLDGSVPPDKEELDLIKELKDKKTIAVINKSDCGIVSEYENIKSEFSSYAIISAKTGEGIENLEKIITEASGIEGLDADKGIIANERQYDCITRAKLALEETATAAMSGASFDVLGLLVEEAISALTELTGEVASDKIIDNVFSRFCVGK